MRIAAVVIGLFLAALLAVPGQASAQNMLLKSGESGFGIAGQLSSGDDWSSRGVVAGYWIR